MCLCIYKQNTQKNIKISYIIGTISYDIFDAVIKCIYIYILHST